MIVRLSSQDMVTSASVGMRREVLSMSYDARPYGGGNRDEFDVHIMGAMAEFVVARRLNLFWQAHIGPSKDGDVGGCVEVRMRRVPGSGTDLAIHPDDIDHRAFVLVHGYRDGRLKIVGWLFGDVAKRRGGPWCEPKQCWFIPPPYEPIESLAAMFVMPDFQRMAQERAAKERQAPSLHVVGE